MLPHNTAGPKRTYPPPPPEIPSLNHSGYLSLGRSCPSKLYQTLSSLVKVTGQSFSYESHTCLLYAHTFLESSPSLPSPKGHFPLPFFLFQRAFPSNPFSKTCSLPRCLDNRNPQWNSIPALPTEDSLITECQTTGVFDLKLQSPKPFTEVGTRKLDSMNT